MSEMLFEENKRFAYGKAYEWNAKLFYQVPQDDLIQLCLLGLHRASGVYREEVGSFLSLANMCIDNEVRMYLRYERKRKRDVPSAEVRPAQEHWHRPDLIDDMLEVMDQLPPLTKKILFMYVVEGYKQSEIGKMFGLKKSLISKKITGAKKKIMREVGHV